MTPKSCVWVEDLAPDSRGWVYPRSQCLAAPFPPISWPPCPRVGLGLGAGQLRVQAMGLNSGTDAAVHLCHQESAVKKRG